jgi:hypothetical protein
MATSAFISYSHSDEKALDRLHKHLAVLAREEELSTWHDRAILPGDKIEGKIAAELDECGLFIALVSPDYLASQYCYDKEFERAQVLAEAGQLRIVPIILEPCDWLSSPISQYKALPKDGLPISEWTNPNMAYLNIVTGLRAVLDASPVPIADREPVETLQSEILSPSAGRQVRLKRDFDVIDKADFADKAFEIFRAYFEGSCAEISQAGEDLKARFEVMNPTAFTCSVVNRAKVRGGEAHISVSNTKRRRHFGGDINYVFERYAETNTSNGSFGVEADDYNLYLTAGSLGYSRDRDSKLSPEQAAERLWKEFVEQAGVEYE